MSYRLPLFFCALLTLSHAARAQEKDAAAPVKVRAVLHDPMNLGGNLYYPDEKGVAMPLNFKPKNLSDSILILPINGMIAIYDKDVIDPKDLSANLVASAKLSEGMTQAIMVVVPYQTENKTYFKIMMIEDSKKEFPFGECKVISMVGVELAVEAGEHKVPIRPGIITRIPPVKNVNEYEMAQTNFYYQEKDSWVVFTERQLQYNDVSRRIFIIYATPGAVQPTVATIFDVNHHAQPF